MKADNALLRRLRAAPESEFLLIVQVSQDVDGAAGRLQSSGLEVRRLLRLISALAVRASGEQTLRLLEEPWVLRVEEDRPVQAL